MAVTSLRYSYFGKKHREDATLDSSVIASRKWHRACHWLMETDDANKKDSQTGRKHNRIRESA